MHNFIYEGAKTKEISFPLGGIGSGCIGLAGNGRLIDWEIFNKPNKGGLNGFSHFAVKAEAGGKVLDARVLNGDLLPPYSGGAAYSGEYAGFGFGIPRYFMTGLPHFKNSSFTGEFPLAALDFSDPSFPGRARLSAFNPFIPLNADDSSIPGAFFSVTLTNTTKKNIKYTVVSVVKNPLTQTVNKFKRGGKVKLIRMTSVLHKKDAPEYGDLTVATDAADVSFQEYWYRGGWFDNLGIYWRDLCAPGKFKNRRYDKPSNPDAFGDHAVLAATVTVKPKESKTVRFLISWNFPNNTNYWNYPKCDCKDGKCGSDHPKNSWKNHYASLFFDSAAAAKYSFDNWERLESETRAFKDALFGSTIPKEALDAISANISILKTPTCLRLEDGSFYGWEGCFCNSGCCEGSCTHVWNYQYALPFLFPSLERSMRSLDYKYNMREDGKLGFRIKLPLGLERSKDKHACADGQMGGIIKAYRDWKISGDDAWLKGIWPSLKLALEFAWAETNEHKWDLDKDGVMEGRQHHTLDTELFGPNAYLTGFYLAALKAAAEMAEYLGETGKASEYRALFNRGKKWVNENLFNGEYFHQKIDLKDIAMLKTFGRTAKEKKDLVAYYWDAEHKELKHQLAEGCHVDQVIAQWHANLIGLGEIFEPAKVKSALKAVYKNNFKKTMRNFYNVCRLYALNDEAALVICDWPKGSKSRRPLNLRRRGDERL